MVGRWGTQAICSHQVAGSIWARSTTPLGAPSSGTILTRPRSGGSRPRRTCVVVVLPAPDGPVSATRLPGRIEALSPAGVHAPREATDTSSSSIVDERRSGAGRSPCSGTGV